jgi:alpha-L-fucosidase
MIKLSRRQALKFFASTAPLLAARPGLAFFDDPIALTKGPFKGTKESLANYKVPDWFGDAKFGIWSHWGPQSGIEHGDWYARKMYMEGGEAYKWHIANFGHPSKVGYKDLVPQFKAAKWDPEHLMDLYVKAGAKYFFSMGVHHDNFDMWNSKYQPRWNAVATGPKRDIVAEWAKAARSRGLKFGVSEHLSNSFEWLAPSHLSDTTGPLAGVPYDGSNPAYADLYHDYSDMGPGFAERIQKDAMGRKDAPTRWKLNYFRRVKDLVDQHKPDLLYTDGGIPFEEYGMSTIAELYNVSASQHESNQAVYFGKNRNECKSGTCTLDRERGVLDAISPEPWQTDTCVGNWHYARNTHYKSAKKVIDLMVDIVSKNGNLLLNFPLPNSGELDADELVTLAGITEWMSVNGEGIYSTRPWKVNGEGPASKVVIASNGKEFDPNERNKPDLGAADFRFTTKNSKLYIFAQGYVGSDKEYVVESLATRSALKPGKIANVVVLGSDEKLKWNQDETGLHISNPKKQLPAPGCCFRISFV